MSGWEHLQDVCIKVQNRRVREHFRDIINDPDSPAWDGFTFNLDNVRQSLASACTLRDTDSATMTLIRQNLFWMILGQASALQAPLYAIPSTAFQEMFRFVPQVTLYFKEDSEDVEEGYSPIHAHTSFRLMGETYQSVTEADLRNVANKIRTEFATSGGYRWQKGRVRTCYKNNEQGYSLQINAHSESVGRSLIEKILDIQNHTVDLEHLTFKSLAATPPTVPPTQNILGKPQRLPRRYPVGYVRFVWAEAHVWGIQHAITLLDRSGRRKAPLVEV